MTEVEVEQQQQRHYVVRKTSSAFFQVGADGVCRYPAVGNVITLTPESAQLLIAGGWVSSAPADRGPTTLSTQKPARRADDITPPKVVTK